MPASPHSYVKVDFEAAILFTTQLYDSEADRAKIRSPSIRTSKPSLLLSIGKACLGTILEGL